VVRDDPFKTDTRHQRLINNWIKELGIGTQVEYEVGKYFIDIYVPDLVLGLEIDGPWHLRKRDKKRDEYILEVHGIEIWRIPIKDINMSYKQELVDRIFHRVREMEQDATTY
jgi:very-short-patch-repair endonuclease